MRTRSTALTTDHLEAGAKYSRLNSTIFVLLCFIPVFGMILFGAVDNITWSLIAVLTAVLIGLWLIDAWGAGSITVAADAIQAPLLALIVLGLVQLLPIGTDTASAILAVPAKHSLSLDPYSTRFFVRNLIVLLIFLTAAMTFVDSERRIRKVALLIAIFGGITAFLAILQTISSTDAIYGLRVPYQANPFGPFVNGHHFAGFMEMTAGLTLGLLLGEMPRQKKVLFVLALVVMIAAILMTSSRGGFIGLLATAGVAGTLRFVNRRRSYSEDEQQRIISPAAVIGSIGIAFVAVILVLLLGGDESLTRGIGLTNAAADVSNGRLHFWSVACQIFLAHPIIGAGLDAYGVAFTQYDSWNGVFRVERAHNDYLQILAEGGLVGIACVASFIYLLFKKGFGTIAAAGHGLRRDAAIGAIAGCTGILVHSFVDFPLRTWSNSFFFLLLAALAVVKVAPDTEPSLRRHRST